MSIFLVKSSLKKSLERSLTFSAFWSYGYERERKREGKKHSARGTSCRRKASMLGELELLILSSFRLSRKTNDGSPTECAPDKTTPTPASCHFSLPTVLSLSPQNTSDLVVGMTLDPKLGARTHLILHVLLEELTQPRGSNDRYFLVWAQFSCNSSPLLWHNVFGEVPFSTSIDIEAKWTNCTSSPKGSPTWGSEQNSTLQTPTLLSHHTLKCWHIWLIYFSFRYR